MENLIEAEHVKPVTTMDIYLVLLRFGNDYWSSSGGSYRTIEDAQKRAMKDLTIEAWRIVKVSGLPLGVVDGEA